MESHPLKFLRSLVTTPQCVSTRPQCKHQINKLSQLVSCPPVKAASKKVLWTPRPKATNKVTYPDREVTEDQVLPKDLLRTNREMVREAQDKWSKSQPDGLLLSGGLWKNKKGLVWVPDEARPLQRLLYVAGHQAPRSTGDSRSPA